MSDTPPQVAKPEVPPEIPQEIASNMKRGRALTDWAAEDMKTDEVIVDQRPVKAGDTFDGGPTKIRLSGAAVIEVDGDMVDAINRLCKAPPGYEPNAGLTADQIREIMAKTYPGMPVQSVRGDLTPDIIVWLFEHHPRDAHVRYYTRLMPSVGVWIARNYPHFKYEPKGGNIVAVDFTQAPGEGRPAAETTPAGAASAKQILLKEIAALKAQIAEDAETKVLRLELEELKKAMAERDAPPPARRPREARQARKSRKARVDEKAPAS